MGTDKGKQPRRLAAGGAYVYLSTFDGYVAAIDTTEYTAAKIYQVGSYPEGMACDNGNLYVANSDYGQGINPSISKSTLKLAKSQISRMNLSRIRQASSARTAICISSTTEATTHHGIR